ncbi:MAG: glycosyltransferase [Gammaproteobacteria bacterium]|nr:glycosyltransferase [Gammaproteobacteria bacterium]
MAEGVSVALCTRNGARFLAEQVQSICKQSTPPREIVVSDDGSSDDSVEVVRRTIRESVAAGAIDLKVFENARPLGVTRNFEQAVTACSQGLIALCDQDDRWHPERLERMTACFDARPELLLLHTDARLVDADLAPLGQTLFHALEVQPFELDAIHGGRAFDVLLRRNLVTGATTVFRRELLVAALPFPKEWLHDEWLGAIAAATGRMDVLEQPLIDYRQHGSNQVGAARPTLAIKIRKAMDSRGSKHVDRAARAQALLDRLLALGDRVTGDCVELQRANVAHQRFRAELPSSRVARVLPVIAEAMHGRYERFGRGRQAVLQDLLEKG